MFPALVSLDFCASLSETVSLCENESINRKHLYSASYTCLNGSA